MHILLLFEGAIMWRTALMYMEQYRYECLFGPAINWPDYEFEDRCYAIEALNELEAILFANRSEDVLSTIESYILKSEMFEESCDGKKTGHIFQIEKETAIDIRDMLTHKMKLN